MTLTFSYTGQLAAAAGVMEESLELEAGATLEAALRELGGRHGGKFHELLFDDEGGRRSTLLVALNDEQVSEDPAAVVLQDGASLMLMTPIAGG
jgi:molybdopterin converting factor small subunit